MIEVVDMFDAGAEAGVDFKVEVTMIGLVL
jgi:hypothetical protein